MWENPSGGAPYKQRKAALQRDRYQCVKCGNAKNLEVDHIKNIASGGTHHLDNLQTLCHHCHKQKTLKEMRAGHQGRKSRGKYPAEPHPGLIKK
ncbi:HNH endonuclease [Corynebacterium tuberculostearicum]|uniref:HNH endonuclease n=1 Tax=Corynebacterium tuberculostearicum TaxID=38304 RepID=UPI003977470E